MSKSKDVVIDESLIIPNLEVNDRKEVIRLLGKKLVAKGYVSDEFIQSVLEREERFPTGLPTKVPVALPHTDAKYCSHSALAVATLKKPVLFKEMDDPNKKLNVKMVFLLALNDRDSQTKWLQALIKLFQSKKFSEKVLLSKNRTEIYIFLERFLKQTN